MIPRKHSQKLTHPHSPDDQTDEDRINEAKIMDEIVVIVDKKDKIVQNIELERERAEVEDIAMSVENKIHIKGNKRAN